MFDKKNSSIVAAIMIVSHADDMMPPLLLDEFITEFLVSNIVAVS